MKVNKTDRYWILFYIVAAFCVMLFLAVGSVDRNKALAWYDKIAYQGKPHSKCSICYEVKAHKRMYDVKSTWVCEECWGRYVLYLKD